MTYDQARVGELVLALANSAKTDQRAHSALVDVFSGGLGGEIAEAALAWAAWQVATLPTPRGEWFDALPAAAGAAWREICARAEAIAANERLIA